MRLYLVWETILCRAVIFLSEVLGHKGTKNKPVSWYDAATRHPDGFLGVREQKVCCAQHMAPWVLPAHRVRCRQGNWQSPASEEQELVESLGYVVIMSAWVTQVSNLEAMWAIW